MNYDRKALKLAAKAAVRSTRPRARLVTLVYTLLASVVPSVILFVALFLSPIISTLTQFFTFAIDEPWLLDDPYMVTGWLLGSLGTSLVVLMFLSILLSLVKLVLDYGYVSWSRKVWKGEGTSYSNLFDGFPRVNRVLGSGIMVGIFTTLWSLIPYGVAALILAPMGDGDNVGLVSSLLRFATTVCVMFIKYRYSLTPYFIMSQPDMGVFEAITASKKAMRGNLGKRFVLDLSFMGWLLLVVGVIYICAIAGVFAGVSQAMSSAVFLFYDVEPTAGEALSLIASMLGWSVGFAFVGAVAILPLSLWLSAYIQTAYAGFFQTVTGQESLTGSGAPPIPPAPSIPPAPPAPPAQSEIVTPPDPFDQVEVPKVEDPFDQAAPQAPDVTVQPETPAQSEAAPEPEPTPETSEPGEE